MLLNIAKLIYIFMLLAGFIGFMNAVICIVEFILKEGSRKMAQKQHNESEEIDIPDSDYGLSLSQEKRAAIRIAGQLDYDEECVAKIYNAKTVSEITRILQTYREATK